MAQPTWLISCAMTPATSPSVLAASIMPRLTNIGPPGANALMSRTFTTSNVCEARVALIGRDPRDEALAEAVDVAVDRLVAQQRQLPTRFAGRLLAELDVLL